MTVIRYLPAAEDDLFDILKTIASDNPAAAGNFNERLRTAILRLVEYPLSAPSREHVRPGLRGLSIGRYIAYYRVAEADVLIVRILHGARDTGHISFD